MPLKIPPGDPHRDGTYAGSAELEPGTWDSSVEVCDDDNDHSGLTSDHHALKETDRAAPNKPFLRRRATKSFSNLRQHVDGLLALGRRLSVSIRRHHHPHHDDAHAEKHKSHARSQSHPHRRHVHGGSLDVRTGRSSLFFKSHSINRRPSLHSPTALHGFYATTEPTTAAPVVRNPLEPPIIPDNAYAGAAARAAAAAHNEAARAERETARLSDSKSPLDSESGIGIDLRERSDSSDGRSSVARAGMWFFLLCYLKWISIANAWVRPGGLFACGNHGASSVMSESSVAHEL